MILAKDFYTATYEKPLSTTGNLLAKYTVKAVSNVRNLKLSRSYYVTCTLRVTFPNSNVYGNPGPTLTPAINNGTATLGYFGYPVFMRSMNSLTLNNMQTSNATWRLVEYNPRTINSSVNVSANLGVNNSAGSSTGSSSGQSQSQNISHTSGSSNSTTNSYSASVTVGYPWSASASASYSHDSSETHDQSQSSSSDSGTSSSRSQSRDAENSSNASYGDAMSVKDWVSYVQLDTNYQSPAWIWAQEYPWDVTKYGAADSNGNVTLPNFVLNQLFNMTYDDKGNIASINDIYAPSALSLTTIDFTMSCVWQIDIDPVSGAYADISVTPSHTITMTNASHGISGSTLPAGATDYFVQLSQTPYSVIVSGPTLDLTLLGLDPITHNRPNNGAVVGFIPNKFLTLMSALPYAELSYFKILSTANNLQVIGTGFTIPTGFTPGSNTPISATVSTATGPVLIVSFKLPEGDFPLNLYLKHWVSTAGSDCTLSFYFNPPDFTPPTATAGGTATLPTTPDLVRYVTSTEGTGADNNLLAINLRNNDYSTIDYHDYLVPGLNVIAIQAGNSSSQSFDYVIRALAIGV